MGNNPFCAAANEEVKEAAEEADLENQDAYGKKDSKNEKTRSKGDGLASRNNSLILMAPEQSDKHKKRLQPTLEELLTIKARLEVARKKQKADLEEQQRLVEVRKTPDSVQMQRQVGPKKKNGNAPAGNQVSAKTNTKPNKQQAAQLAQLAQQKAKQQMPPFQVSEFSQNRAVQLLNQKQPSQHIADPTRDLPKKIGESIKELPQQKAAALAAQQQRKAGLAAEKAQLEAERQKLLIQEPDSDQIKARIIGSIIPEESKDDYNHEITQDQEERIELTNCFKLNDGKIFQLVLNKRYDLNRRDGESTYTNFIKGYRTNRVGKAKEKAHQFLQNTLNTDISSLKQDRTLKRVQKDFAVKILDINGFTISSTERDKAQEVDFIGEKCTLYQKDGKYCIKSNEEGAEFKDYNITPPKKEVMFSPQVMFSQQNIKAKARGFGYCTTVDLRNEEAKPKNFVLKREGVGIYPTEWEYNAQALKNDLKKDLKNDPTNSDKIGDRTGTFKMDKILPLMTREV